MRTNEDDGVNVRSRFLLDPDGIVQATEVLSPPVGRNVDELVRQISAFKHARETGEAAPGNAISPNAEMLYV